MRNLKDVIQGLLHPEAYHGRGVSHEFFEGWYIKIVSADMSQRWAIIPGIFRGMANSNQGGSRDEAFLQILDGLTGRSWYHSYDVSQFSAATKHFEVQVGPNHFSSAGIHLDTPQLSGDIDFTSALDPWPVTVRQPGVMGWYGHVPFMECFHGVVSFGHDLAGSLVVEGVTQDFHNGRGYIEKDWGRAFPEAYIWLASNHIDTDPTASFMGSVAVVPWLGGAFRGYVVGLKHGETLYRWATYTKAREIRLEVDDTNVFWTLQGDDGTLELVAKKVQGGLLKAPQRHAMLERVEETLDAQIYLKHTNASGKVLLEGTAKAAGLEIVGDINKLISLRTRNR